MCEELKGYKDDTSELCYQNDEQSSCDVGLNSAACFHLIRLSTPNRLPIEIIRGEVREIERRREACTNAESVAFPCLW